MDIQKIEDIIEVLQGSHAQEISISRGDTNVCVRKGSKPKATSAKKKAAAAKTVAHTIAAEPQSNDLFVRAAMVGLFHKAEVLSADAEVSVGQVVGSIESMKLLNDVVSQVSGTVREVLVEDGMPVEYGQLLFRVEPA